MTAGLSGMTAASRPEWHGLEESLRPVYLSFRHDAAGFCPARMTEDPAGFAVHLERLGAAEGLDELLSSLSRSSIPGVAGVD